MAGLRNSGGGFTVLPFDSVQPGVPARPSDSSSFGSSPRAGARASPDRCPFWPLKEAAGRPGDGRCRLPGRTIQTTGVQGPLHLDLALAVTLPDVDEHIEWSAAPGRVSRAEPPGSLASGQMNRHQLPEHRVARASVGFMASPPLRRGALVASRIDRTRVAGRRSARSSGRARDTSGR